MFRWLLLLFRCTVFLLPGTISAGTFSQPMTRTDALYFIVPGFRPSGSANYGRDRWGSALTGQMIAGIVIIGIGARISLTR